MLLDFFAKCERVVLPLSYIAYLTIFIARPVISEVVQDAKVQRLLNTWVVRLCTRRP